jgi:hypothetical protein
LNADGTLSVFTGETEFGFFGGATHETSSAVQASTAAWAETTFFDTLSAPGPQIFLIAFQSSVSSYASLGAFGNQGHYSAHWRTDSTNPADAILGTTVDVGPRSFGVHTARIGRRQDHRLEFWLDGRLVLVTGTTAFPGVFNFVSLIGSGATTAGQVATFIDYSEGTGAAAVQPPTVTSFTDRLSWQASSGPLIVVDFEGLPPAGGFASYDSSSGLSMGNVQFTGLTRVAGPTGPTRWYLRAVDSAHSPPLNDWGSGAVLQGPPIPVGPQGEGGPDSHVHVRLPPSVHSVGVDLMSVLPYASSFRVVVATSRGSVAFSANSAPYPTRSFFGFTADSPVLSVDYYALNGFPVLDNLAFGTTAVEPPCTLSLSPGVLSLGAQGGPGSFVVLTAPLCSWSATVDANWITLLPGSACATVGDVVVCPRGTRKVGFVVASNPGAARVANISVGDREVHVTQQGAPACTFSIGPSRATVGSPGVDLRVNVTATPADAVCNWTATSNVGWLTVTSGASGSRSGSVRLHADANIGGPRTGTATIAGQTFSVTQSASACGAVDVTSQVRVNRSGLTYLPFTSYLYSGNITVTNTHSSGSAISGPLFLVLMGLPTHRGYPDDSGLLGPQLQTTCFSAQGDYLVPLPGGALAFGQARTIPLVFVSQRLAGGIFYSTRVLSGQPSR